MFFSLTLLLKETSVFVAVHGAALAFIPFLHPLRGAVVEIVPYGHPDPMFFSHLARVSAIPHTLIQAEAAHQPSDVVAARAPYVSPVTCDVGHVVKAVRAAFDAMK